MDKTEIIANIGVIIAGVLGILAGYFSKKNSKTAIAPDTVVAGVGLEFGNRMQMDELIKEVRRVGDILENKKQAGIEAKLDDLLEEIDDLRGDRNKAR